MEPPADPTAQTRKITVALLAVTFAIVPLNSLVFFFALDGRRSSAGGWIVAFLLLAFVQFVCGLAALITGIAWAVALGRVGHPKTRGVLAAVAGALGMLGGVGGGTLGLGFLALAAGGMGGAWGRPLRIRGRVVHPELSEGTDWTRGPAPDVSGLDADTRAALEALWLHDAQKEHASVPAFARVTWVLTAAGAPAELVDRALVAAREEVEHTRLCFALAAGYGGRSHAVEPMPDLLLGGGLDVRGDAFVHLAVESLKDGCLLEDYNADVAAECAVACRDAATGAALRQIAVEERSHAELSWSIVAWCLDRGGAAVRACCARELEALATVDRPTAVSAEKRALVERADPEALRAHGRLPDARWAELWVERLGATRARLDAMLRAAAPADADAAPLARAA